MDTLTTRLEEWANAGLITQEQAERIAAHEAARHEARGPTPAGLRRRRVAATAGEDDRPAPSATTAPGERRLTSPAEAIGYVGAALALGAIFLILGDLWDELLLGGRLALVAVLTIALLGSGAAVQASRSRAMQRLASVLLTGSVGGVGWFAAVIASDVVGLRDVAVGLTVGLAMFVAGTALYLWTPRALLQLVTLAAAVLSAGTALGLSPLDPGPEWYGIVIGSLGLVWLVLAVGGWLIPRAVADVAGSVVTFVGVQLAAFGDEPAIALGVGVVLAAMLVAWAVRGDVLHHLVVGALALFVLTPQLVFELFGDAIGAPATLLLVGLLLVLLAAGLGRARREVARGQARAEGAEEAGAR